MAKLLNNQTDEQLAANTYFVDAEILKNVYYQVYGFDKVYCHDDEGANYRFNNTNKSNIQIQIVTATTNTYYQVDTPSLGAEVENQSAAPAGAIMVESYPNDLTDAKVGDIYCIETVTPGQDEEPDTYSYNYKTVTASFKGTTLDITNSTDYETIRTHFKGNAASSLTVPAGAKADDVYCVVTETLTPAEAADSTAYEYNKYGEIKPNSKIYVTIDVNDTLKSTYTDATITIDGKDYDLGLDGKTITFTMDKDHKIQINWVYGVLVESFRITCKR